MVSCFGTYDGAPLRRRRASRLALRFGDRQAEGLLGSDVLSRFGAVTIDYAHGRLLLP
jgi:hypothetical protein